MALANVLLIEDNPSDQLLLKQVITEAGWVDDFCLAPDGEEALAYLNDTSRKFDLVILDLNLPKMCGRDLLAQIRSLNQYKTLPIIVLTASHLKADFQQSYELGANCYLNKSADLDDYLNTISRIGDIWKFLREN